MRALLEKLAGITLPLRASWLAFGGACIILAAALLLHVPMSRAGLAEARLALLESDLAAAATILNGLPPQQNADAWDNPLPNPTTTQDSPLPSRLLLINAEGRILADSGSQLTLPADLASLAKKAASGDPQSLWLPEEIISFTALPVPSATAQDNPIFIRLVDHQQNIAAIRQQQTANMLLYALFALLLTALAALALWHFYFRPVQQLGELAETVSIEGKAVSVPAMPTVELNQVGQSIHQMIEKIISQQNAVEDLNRQLEERVKRRTGELHNATLSLQQRAAEINSLNILMNSAFSAESLPELADHAVRDAVRLMQANAGEITLNDIQASYNLPNGSQLLSGITEVYGIQPAQEILIHDWQSLTLPPKLLEVGNSLKSAGIHSTISLPILVGREVVGRLSLAGALPNRWQERDLDLARIICRQLGAAAERIRVFEDSQLNNRLMAKLIIHSERLNRNYNLSDLVKAIGKASQELTGVQQAAMFLLEQSNQYTCAWHVGIGAQTVATITAHLHGPQNKDILSLKSPLLLDDLSNPAESPPWIYWNDELQDLSAAGVLPLIFEQQVSAVVLVFYRQPAQWKRIELEVFQAFTRQAAIALENSRLMEVERDNRNLAEALRDVASALNSTMTVSQVNDRILTILGRVVPHDAADIMMIDSGKIDIVTAHGYPVGTPSLDGLWPQTLESFGTYSRIAETGQSMVIPDTRRNSNWIKLPNAEWIRSWAAAPIRARGQVVGFINVCSRKASFYNAHHGLILQTFADQASSAIENARLFATAHREMSEAGSLFRALTPLLIPGGNLNALAEQFVHAVRREFNVGHCSMLIMDEESERLNIIQQAGWILKPPHPLLIAGDGLTVSAARSGRPVYAPDVSQEPLYIIGSESTRSEFAIPFKSGSRVLGVLNIESEELDYFDEQTRKVIVSLVEQASLVLENHFLLENTRRNARQTEILNQITQISLQAGLAEQALQGIAERVGALLAADGCYIAAWDEVTRQSTPLAKWGIGLEGFDKVLSGSDNRTLTAALVDAGRPLALDDVLTGELIDLDWALSFPLPSFLGSPLISGGIALGAILVSFNGLHHFTRRETNLLEQAAAQIALVLAKIQSLEMAQAQLAQSEKLRQATAALTTTLDYPEVIRRIKLHLPTLLRFDDLVIFEVHEHTLKMVAQHNAPGGDELLGSETPITDEIFQHVKRTKQPLAVDDAQLDPRIRHWERPELTHSFLSLPLLAGNEIVCLVNVGRQTIQPFSAEEILAARVFANQAGVALQNSLLHSELQQWATTDPLTGLYNRRGFFGLARHELERSRRFTRPLSVLIMDIDRFKAVNDTYGHPVGDVVLQQMANRFRDVLREIDLICRYGGEEFCILLSESDLEGAVKAAERILHEVSCCPFETRVGPLNITISIGLASLEGADIGLEELLDQADKALFQAKTAGRNQVACYEP